MSGTGCALWVLIILAFPILGAFVWLSWGQDPFRRRIGAPTGHPPVPAPERPRR
ncbi:hypothetical protein B7495_13085 [Cryobacterium sp. LW097]|uniref:PLDc N-terminal domain-containing protein n=1 Tax=unclassified Cryobacterium TaxID=2649013 RepID=UPI000B4CD192|nr:MULTISPECIES: PLDc N-terminal domain-containing protein [unclassified Cryobacterium]ASD22909.1 hypothetical protein B7495_13085 [Cryobacterium sp. LW097]TFC50271.1 hypothetical protein E3O68_17835 [Cryobacterium sp. TMB3-1-2]TFC71995.1 hypothetical protein E3T21_07570 [Cryobacterium sp. TMB3-15]TFC78588.1 hypothetical protein E3T22_03765 [Cryobacterium sp. TMB3-10]TFD39275.1 hypothetical protein E3T58_15600 [Cryobacterium sp. TMB3-12]